MTQSNVWFVTGTSTGLGRELAEAIIARGDRLIATVRNEGVNRDLVEKAPDRVRVIALDVTDPARIQASIAEAKEAFGRIDLLVNNAGYGLFGAIEENTEEQMRKQIETNLLGSMLMIKAVLPLMREQKSGHIIQISSVGGQLATPGLSAYHASKWGIEGFCESLASEVAGFGIKVTVVEPGGIRTDWAGRSMVQSEPMAEYADTPVGQMRQHIGGIFPVGDPVKMARAIASLADRQQAPFRLALGSDAYTLLQARLPLRIEQLEAEKAITLSTDTDEQNEDKDQWKRLLPDEKHVQ